MHPDWNPCPLLFVKSAFQQDEPFHNRKSAGIYIASSLVVDVPFQVLRYETTGEKDISGTVAFYEIQNIQTVMQKSVKRYHAGDSLTSQRGDSVNISDEARALYEQAKTAGLF